MIKSPKSEAYNMDNLAFLRNCYDREFDVGIVDPEYRDINQPDIANRAKGGFKSWKGSPKEEYFYHLFRVTKHQIIFGGNYFTGLLDWSRFKYHEVEGLDVSNYSDVKPFLESNNNWYIWDKKMARGLHYSMAEMAWVSFRKNVQIFRLRSAAESWHETGKPVELYHDLFKTYIEDGMTILDTNLGSGASRIAAWALGFPFTGIEIDPVYFKKSCEDFERYKNKNGMFMDSENDFSL